MEDWRLKNQINYIYGKSLIFDRFISSNVTDHTHCIFCYKKFLKNDYGYTDEMGNWICAECYCDFKEMFNWSLKH